MTEDDRLHVAAQRADHATRLLKDELLNEAFEKLEATYLAAWRSTGMSETETHKREKLFLAINLLGKVKEHLQTVVNDGKIAKADILDITRKRPRAA